MAVYSYAETFKSELLKKYARELTSFELTQSNPQIQFLNEQTIKLPTITLSGYKDHSRSAIGFNQGTISNDWIPKKLAFDRDVEFFIDPLDISETNLSISIANITNQFEEEQAIPEKDSYRFSKLYSDAVTYASNGAVVDTTSLTTANILDWIDTQSAVMDDAGVPTDGRVLYLTSAAKTLLKSASGITRTISVGGGSNSVNRNINRIDDMIIKSVPSGRFKTSYDFSDGCTPAAAAKQMNIMLIHPSCVVSRDRYSYINVFTPGHDSRTADKYIYQNRYFSDTFLLQTKAEGIAINVTA